MHCLLILTISVTAQNLPGPADAARPYIYRVLADRFPQTGFRLQGTKGIVTALHGVVGAKTITASCDGGLGLQKPLRIGRVDIESDLALLVSDELEVAGADGLRASIDDQWRGLEKVSVIGYPEGLQKPLVSTQPNLRNPPIRPLHELIGNAETLRCLNDRHSPEPKRDVFSIEGALLPGHSGAPVLDASGKVIAVANGGLRAGAAQISWAIPIKDAQWNELNPERQNVLIRLAGLPDCCGVRGSGPELVLVSLRCHTRQDLPNKDDAYLKINGQEISPIYVMDKGSTKGLEQLGPFPFGKAESLTIELWEKESVLADDRLGSLTVTADLQGKDKQTKIFEGGQKIFGTNYKYELVYYVK